VDKPQSSRELSQKRRRAGPLPWNKEEDEDARYCIYAKVSLFYVLLGLIFGHNQYFLKGFYEFLKDKFFKNDFLVF